jgi:hypothetical protein
MSRELIFRAKWPDLPATRRSSQRSIKPRVAVRVAAALSVGWDVARLAYGGWRPSSSMSLELVQNPWRKRHPVPWQIYDHGSRIKVTTRQIWQSS